MNKRLATTALGLVCFLGMFFAMYFLVSDGSQSGQDNGDHPQTQPDFSDQVNTTQPDDAQVEDSKSDVAPALVKLESGPNLLNLIQVDGEMFSGGEPKDEAAFQRLKALGVKSVVSVDGAKPNLEMAKKYGMKYAHVPIGYDGLSREEQLAMVAAVEKLPRPIYIHCHHGKHRGPAMATVYWMVWKGKTADEAVALMELAGTSQNYGGLWRDVRSFKAKAADEADVELKEIQPVGDTVSAMAKIDRVNDNMKLFAANGFELLEKHPDLTPVQESLILHELFFELNRLKPDADRFDEDYWQRMQRSSDQTRRLHDLLKAGDKSKAELVYSGIRDECRSCHKSYR